MGPQWLQALTGILTTTTTTPGVEPQITPAHAGGGAPMPLGGIGDYCARFPNHPACLTLPGKGAHGGHPHHNGHGDHSGGGIHHHPLS